MCFTCLMKISLILKLRKGALRIVALKAVRCPRRAQPTRRRQLRVLISVASGSLSYLRKVALPYTKHHGEKD